MSDLEANKNTVLKFFELTSANDLDPAKLLLHDDVEWWILGDLPTSGTHSGPDAVMSLYSMIGQILVLPIKLNFTAITAEEDRVAIEMNIDAMFVSGIPYVNVYHMLFRLKDGKIFRVNEYFDTKYVAGVFPS